MGRPKKVIDEAEVARLAFEGASNREIADILGCDDKTIANRFSAILRKQRAERRLKIRQAQTRAAESGNPALLIWLGKQELDQRDTVQIQPASEDKPRIKTPTHDKRLKRKP